MEYVIGILLLVSFFGLVVYAVKGGNLMLGIFVMGIIWTVLPMVGNMLVTNPEFIAANKEAISITWTEALQKVFQSGPEGWGVCTCQCCIWCVVWTGTYEYRNRFYINSYNNRAWR